MMAGADVAIAQIHHLHEEPHHTHTSDNSVIRVECQRQLGERMLLQRKVHTESGQLLHWRYT